MSIEKAIFALAAAIEKHADVMSGMTNPVVAEPVEMPAEVAEETPEPVEEATRAEIEVEDDMDVDPVAALLDGRKTTSVLTLNDGTKVTEGDLVPIEEGMATVVATIRGAAMVRIGDTFKEVKVADIGVPEPEPEDESQDSEEAVIPEKTEATDDVDHRGRALNALKAAAAKSVPVDDIKRVISSFGAARLAEIGDDQIEDAANALVKLAEVAA